MKMKKILYRIMVIMILAVIGNSCICFASDDSLPSLDDTYKPTVSMPTGGSAMNIIVSILNVLTVLGVIAVVVSIALIGFGSILGSADQKAAGQEKYMGIVIASLLITGGSIIAKMIISVAENI